MFGNRKKATTPPPEKRYAIGDPFAVIPVKPENVEVKEDSRGMIHLRLWDKPKGLTGKVVDWLRYDYSRKLELDETARCITVASMDTPRWMPSPSASPRSSRISRKDAEQAVILFTKKLMTMDFSALIIPGRVSLARRSHDKSITS